VVKIQNADTIVPSELRNDRFFMRFVSDSFVNYEGVFVNLVITIRCKRRVKNCKFQFDSLTVKWFLILLSVPFRILTPYPFRSAF
jgi:hypothetical protein